MQLRTEVEIAASPDRVWAVLTDFGAYPGWNPFIASIEGELRLGSRLRVAVTMHDGTELRSRPRLSACVPSQELRWTAYRWLPTLLTVDHLFLLNPANEGRTRLVHGQDLSGWLLDYLGERVTLTVRGMVHMNEALKARVEAAS
jgi:hypothetical protein